MPNAEIRKNNETRIPKGSSQLHTARFGLWNSGFFRHSSFVIRHSDFMERFPVNVERAFAKADEDDLLH